MEPLAEHPGERMETRIRSQRANATDIAEVAEIVVILNPASGRGVGRRSRARLASALDQAFAAAGRKSSWEIWETSGPGDALHLANKAARAGAAVVAAAGGDGTCGDVVNGIVGTGAKLGIIPLGTGNDFARAQGLNVTLESSAEMLVMGCGRRIDLGRAGAKYFINTAGCGFDAVVAGRVNRGFRRLRGAPAYVAAVFQTLVSFRPPRMCVEIDGERLEVKAMLCCAANSTSYGGGMKIAPDARIDDGQLDACVLREAGRLEFLLAFPRVFRGTHVSHPKFQSRKAYRITIQSDPPMPVLIDGEIFGQSPVTIEVVPSVLELITA